MKSIKDNAQYVEEKTSLEVDETDWIDAKINTLVVQPKEIKISKNSTPKLLKSYKQLNDGDKIIITDENNAYEEHIVGDVVIEPILHSKDPFGDGSLVAKYELDGNAKDTCGNYDGTWYGTEAYDIGKFDKAGKFDGSNYLSLNKNIISNIQTNISLWFFTEKANEEQILLNIQQNDAGWTNFEIKIDSSGKLSIGGRENNHSSANHKKLYNDYLFKSKKWYHLVLNKINNKTYLIYINNVMVGSFDFTFYLPSNSFRQVMGVFQNKSDDSDNRHYLKGLIDQVEIYNRALTADEIDTLYNQQQTPYSVKKIGKMPSFGNIGSNLSLSEDKMIITKTKNNSWPNSQGYCDTVIDKGNIYWECKVDSNRHQMIGVSTTNSYQANYFTMTSSGYAWYKGRRQKYHNASGVSYGRKWEEGDIPGIRYCYETGELEFYLNGISQGIAYKLEPMTKVYPAFGFYHVNTVLELVVSPDKLKYLPDDCTPYGNLIYDVAINSSIIPDKCFYNDIVEVEIDIEDAENRVINEPNEYLIIDKSTKEDGSNIVTTSPYSLITNNLISVDGVIAPGGSVLDESILHSKDPFGDGSLVAKFPLDGNANDLCGNYNGIWHGAEEYEKGKFGKAAKINSSSEICFTEIILKEDFTVSFWISLLDNSGSKSRAYVVNNGAGGNQLTTIAIQASGEGRIDTISNGGDNNIFFPEPLKINTFYHFVIGRKNGKGFVYMDNKLINNNISKYVDNSDFKIAQLQRKSGSSLLEQVEIYNRALSSYEVEMLYNFQNKYTQELPNHNLTTKPKKAYLLGGINIDKISSTTTEFIGNYPDGDILRVGDKIQLDSSLVPITNITCEHILHSEDPFGDGSLVAKYELDGNAKDTCGNYDGIWVNGEKYQNGKFGKRGVFDNHQYLKTGIDSTKVKTFSCFANFSNLGNWRTLARNDNWQLSSDTKKHFSMWCSNGSPLKYYSSKKTIELDTTYHIVYVISDNNLKLYVDSVLLLDINTDNYTTKGTGELLIGRWNGTNQDMMGTLEQVEIYNRVLTQEEIKILYTQQMYKYTLGFEELPKAPEFCKIPNRSTKIEVVSKTFDGTNFTYIYNNYAKKGRSIQRKITAEKAGTTILEPLSSIMYKRS